MISKKSLSTLVSVGAFVFVTACDNSPEYQSKVRQGTTTGASKDADSRIENGGSKTEDSKGEKEEGSSYDDGDDKSSNEKPDAGTKNPGEGTVLIPDAGMPKDPVPKDPTPKDPTPKDPIPTDPVPDLSEAAAIKKKCTPEVTISISDDAGGRKFSQNVPDPKLAMVQAAQYICSVLYRKASEVPPVTKVKLIVRPMDGVAYATGSATSKEINFSSTYIAGIGGDAKLEIDGVLIHEGTHLWQHSGNGADGGLIEGVADFVRAGGGWYPAGSRNRTGGKYNDAYTTSAYFIGWLNQKYPDFANKFNLSMKAYPGSSIFKTLTGTDVNVLWNQYQQEGIFSPKSPAWVAKQVPLKLGM